MKNIFNIKIVWIESSILPSFHFFIVELTEHIPIVHEEFYNILFLTKTISISNCSFKARQISTVKPHFRPFYQVLSWILIFVDLALKYQKNKNIKKKIYFKEYQRFLRLNYVSLSSKSLERRNYFYIVWLDRRNNVTWCSVMLKK